MFRNKALVIGLCVAPALLAFAPQKRASEKKALTFQENLAAAKTAFEGEKFGTTLRLLNDAVAETRKKHRAAILAAMPAAPAGWTKEVQEESDSGQDAAVLAMLGGGMIPIEQNYTKEDSGATLSVQVTVDQPMVQMITMAFNPAFLEEGQELIEYNGGDKALLRSADGRAEMQLVVSNKHLIQVDVSEGNGDFVLSVLDQAALDKLKGAIEN
ncbi:MAG: hypothetical protein R3F17_07180 [Planctomycetota bacterium]